MIHAISTIYGARVSATALTEVASVGVTFSDENDRATVIVYADDAVKLYRELGIALEELAHAGKLPAPQGRTPITRAEAERMSEDGP